MSHTTAIPTRSFGYYLNGNWHAIGREVVVTSPYDRSIVAVVCGLVGFFLVLRASVRSPARDLSKNAPR